MSRGTPRAGKTSRVLAVASFFLAGTALGFAVPRPRALAGPLASLEGTGWSVDARFPGWIDGGDGEVAVLRRR